MYILLLLALAVAPGIALGFFVWLRDKYEREPLGIIVMCGFLGALSIIPAIILEKSGEGIFGAMNAQSVVSAAFHAFLIVGLSEEVSKFIVLRGYAYRKTDFNEPFDGIVYSVMVSMGFATLENILYVLEGGITVAILRMFLSVPAHATFGVIMGYFTGLAKFRGGDSWALNLLGVLAAAAFHGAFDFFLFLDSTPLLALGAVVSLVAGVVLSMRAMRLHNQNSPYRVA